MIDPRCSPRPTRREVLKTASCGFGYLALRGLCAEALAGSGGVNPLAPKLPHFAPRAKRVIFLFMFGGPSQMDTFDYKPKTPAGPRQDLFLARRQGEQGSDDRQGQAPALLRLPWKFAQHGRSGLWVSELFPHLADHVDDLCILPGMHTDRRTDGGDRDAHGSFQFVRPSVGSWVLYGLGTENQDLPGFITVTPAARFGAQNYGSAFLPGAYQATRIGDEAEAVANVKLSHLSAAGIPASCSGRESISCRRSTAAGWSKDRENQALEGSSSRTSWPRACSRRSRRSWTLLRAGRRSTSTASARPRRTTSAGNACSLAGSPSRACASSRSTTAAMGASVITENWDQHRDLVGGHTKHAKATDRPIAAITDLKRRGLLEDTLLVWGGEFGRTPTAQGRDGRDHNAAGFTMWMAGGGVKGGMCHGATDEYGDVAVEGRVHVHDLHATILHLLGLDHTRLTYHYSGRDFRLTDVHGRVVDEIFA
ncbi:MAG: DUF1501 domain-containing protein [Singulisphaera sp.]